MKQIATLLHIVDTLFSSHCLHLVGMMQATRFDSAKRQSTTSGKGNWFFRKLTMLYVVVVLPGVLIYFCLMWLTDLRGRELFYAFLPSALVFVILYLLYLAWPLLTHQRLDDREKIAGLNEEIPQNKSR